MNPYNNTITGLWVGDSLPILSVLCIKSFLDHGHRFQLFTYKHYDNIPEGTIIRDANEILPEDAIFRDWHNSFAPFSDWFRMEFLYREGGFWVDMDVACLGDTLPKEFPWYCEQGDDVVAVGALGFPAGHPVPDILRQLAADPATPAPWDTEQDAADKQNMLQTMPDVRERRRSIPWGFCGPVGLTKALTHYGLRGAAQQPSRIYPIHHCVWHKCYNGECHLYSPELNNAWAIHLWGEMLRRDPEMWKNLTRDSIIGELIDRHLPVVDEGVFTRTKTHILVGICSCLKAGERRKACRETWLSRPAPGIECRFFLGSKEPLADEPDVVNLWVNDDYAHLPAKGLEFYKYALKHFDFDWLFKCDDDTYLALDRLASLCDDRYGLIGDGLIDCRRSPSGGAGYLMSRQLVEKIVANADMVPPTGAEDIIFGELAEKLGETIISTPRLRAGSTPVPLPYNDQVSCHWCTPTRLRDINHFFLEHPIAKYKGTHGGWEDTILFYANNRFVRLGSGCTGSYLLEADSILLKWDGWPQDTLMRHGNAFSSASLKMEPLDETLALPATNLGRKEAVMRCVCLKAPGESIEGIVELALQGYTAEVYPVSQEVHRLRDTRYEEFHSFLGYPPGHSDRPYVRSLRISFANMLLDPSLAHDDFIIFAESDATPVGAAADIRALLEEEMQRHPEADVFRLFHEYATEPATKVPDNMAFDAYYTSGHTRNSNYVWGTHALVIPAKSRQKVADIFMDCRIPIDTALEAASGKGELNVRVLNFNLFYQKPRTTKADTSCLFSNRHRRMALCLSSYKRPEDLLRQIFAMMHQNYDNFHLFVAAKGMSEFFVNTFIVPQVRSFIEAGRLTIRCYPNRNQLANFLDTVRDLDISDFELFLKIDDDDLYSPDYLATINEFYLTAPQHYSCYFSDYSWTLHKPDGIPSPQLEHYYIFGSTLVLSRAVMKRVMEAETNPDIIRDTMERHCGEAHTCIGLMEDNFIHKVMEDFGCENLATFVKKRKMPFLVLMQRSNASVLRGGLLTAENGCHADVTDKEAPSESYLMLFHPQWRDTLRIYGNRATRLTTGDKATIVSLTEDHLEIQWDQWGKEAFHKNATGAFQLC